MRTFHPLSTTGRQSGFTLIEVVVSLGILTLVFLGIVAVMSSAASLNSNVKASSDLLGVVTTLQTLPINPGACQAAVAGNVFNVGRAASTTAADGMPMVFNLPGLGAVGAGARLGDTIVQWLTFSSAVAAGTNGAGNVVYYGSVMLQARKSQAQAGNPFFSPRLVGNFFLEINSSNRVVSCRGALP